MSDEATTPTAPEATSETKVEETTAPAEPTTEEAK